MKLFSLLVGLLLTGQVWANIGSVTDLTGDATIKRGKETITVSKGTVIEMNDKVETKNGKLTIVFKDETNVKVTEHSALVIDDFVYDPKTDDGKIKFKAALGTVRYTSGKIAHKNSRAVNIRTPTAAIAVRGTDFVMSVNEIGGSMVILMPSCDWESSAIKGVTCSSGKIDVESGPNLITMNKPFQATLVETSGAPPTPPVIVNLSGTPIGNNLQIAPPQTASGANVVAAARAAAEKTGDFDPKKEEKEAQERQVAEDRHNGSDSSINEKQKIVIDTNNLGIAVGDVTEENPHVIKIYKDKSETQQVAWQYASLSENGNNYASVALPMTTQALVIVTQDSITDAFNFNSASSKAYGTIIINQTYR